MHQKKADYTNIFCHLMNEEIQKDRIYQDNDFQIWKKRWSQRLKTKNNTPEKYIELMKTANPLIIPRNHKVEEALKEAELNNLKPINQFIEILNQPYTKNEDILNYQIPSNLDEKYQTFCGT